MFSAALASSPGVGRARFAVSGAVNLRESDRPYLVWDSHQRGLAVSVWPTGHKS